MPTDPPAAEAVPPALVDAVVLAYLDEPLLRDSVRALLASEGVRVTVTLVDNGCTNGDVGALAAEPGVRVTGTGRNVGFSAGCNAGVAQGDAEYVALVNGDAVVEPGALARLVRELAEPGVGIAAGCVRLADQPDLLNSRGNVVHVLGLSWVGGLGEPDTRVAPTETAGAMGAFLVLRRSLWHELGGFYENYFAYHEDAEISIRTWQRGQRVVNVPDAICLHRFEFNRNPDKYYLVERNRLMFVLTVWGGRALALLAPPLVALELAMWLLAAKQGFLPAKFRGYRWLWRHRAELRDRRRVVRATALVPDREWMRVLSDELDTPLVVIPPAVRATLNWAVRRYWSAVARFV